MNAAILMLAVVFAQEKPNAESTPPTTRVRDLDPVLTWNEIALEAIRKERQLPPMAARSLALLHLAIFDCVQVLHPDHVPFHVRLIPEEDIDDRLAVSAAARRMLVHLFPGRAAVFDRAYDQALAASRPGKSRTNAVQLGKYVADKLILHRIDDGSATAKTAKSGRTGIGFWEKTPPAYAAGILPGWGKVKPFGIRSARDHQAPLPPDLTSQEYTRDFDEVKVLGKFGSSTRTAEESIIAWFWDDGPGTCTPVGHWNQIALEAALDRKLSWTENARLFALLNMALADAAIVCWESKYSHRVWRPVTAIRKADRDGNENTEAEKDWEPLLTTPAFPSYVSGHSTFSGAAARMLDLYFGTDRISFTIRSDGFPGQERSFHSFSDAAREAGRSRIYGGIHYEFDNREGQALGKRVSEEIFRTRLRPKDSTTRLERRFRKDSNASSRRESP